MKYNRLALQKLSKQELIRLIRTGSTNKEKKQKISGITVPSFVFCEELSALESIVKYLKENKNMTYHEIAVSLKRNDRTIWSTYNNSLKKRKNRFKQEKVIFTFPIMLLCDRNVGVLEHITIYLKENKNMTYHEIAVALKRNDRTIWTTYQRTQKKRRRKQ